MAIREDTAERGNSLLEEIRTFKREGSEKNAKIN
jgi:hypothetical protein